MNTFLKSLIHFAALVLFSLSIQKAWAGAAFYRGEQALKQERYRDAVESFERALKSDPDQPRALGEALRALYLSGLEKKNKEQLMATMTYAKRFTGLAPLYGKGWLYLGLFQMEAEKAGDGLSQEEWDLLKPLFYKAVSLEPGSAWMKYNAAKAMLSQDAFLSTKERSEALVWIRKAVESFLDPHYPYLDKSSIYLKPALSFVWKKYRDLEILKKVTPADQPSYGILLTFLQESGLWVESTDIYNNLLELQKESYDIQCRRGEEALTQGRPREAYNLFRKAFWMRSWAYQRAKAGVLGAQGMMGYIPEGKHDLFQENYRETLQKILQEEDENLDKTIEFLGPAVGKTGSAYLSGLYAYRLDRFRETISKLGTAPEQGIKRLILARSYEKIGQTKKAVEILKPVLDEKEPDLRELLLLNRLSPTEAAELKIQNAGTRHRNRSAWFKRPAVNGKSRMAMGLQLQPGKANIRLALKGKGDPFIVLRLNERELRGKCVETDSWTFINVPVETAGGQRWLVVELINGTKSGQGPSVELGPVKISYEKEMQR